MNFTQEYLTSGVVWGSHFLMGCLLVAAVFLAPWSALMRYSSRQHAFLGAIVILSLLWSFRFQLMPGLYMHLFLTPALTLIFGVALSLVAGALALVLVFVFSDLGWQSFSLSWLMTVFIPVGLSAGLLWVLGRLPTKNLFFYILGLGFFGAQIVTVLTCASLVVYFYFFLADAQFQSLWDKIPFTIPLVYAEGFINGVIVTSVTVYAPDLVKTFDDQRFLKP